jgi:hypothetical protein
MEETLFLHSFIGFLNYKTKLILTSLFPCLIQIRRFNLTYSILVPPHYTSFNGITVSLVSLMAGSLPSLHTALSPWLYHRLVAREFAIRRLAKMHIHVACAFVGPGGLFGSLFGTAPFY